MKKTSNSGFTLIELLVVIGIIGVLSAVMLGLLGGSGDAARATQCMTNMRGLSIAVINYTMQNDDGNYPPAGSLKYTEYSNGVSYPTRAGWISWNKGDNSNSKSCPSYISFNDSDSRRERILYAITNGCIWTMGGKTEAIYRCPIHDAACLKANKRHPGWSYVMNESFAWNSSGKPFASWRGINRTNVNPYDTTSKGNKSRPPEKVLLFAEIQGLDDGKRGLVANTEGSGTEGDGVLQYHSGKSESMGFNHVQSGGKLSGHVAFADGHVEKYMYPANGNTRQLTEWLCSGREVSYNGTNYQDIQQGQ